MILNIKRATVIVPHPDDETLGVGGTLLKFKKIGIQTSCIVASGHLPPLYKMEDYLTTENESKKAFKKYGIKKYEFLKLPATTLNQFPFYKLNKMILSHLMSFKPDLVFIPFPDRHIDHKIMFESSMVVTRPTGKHYPKIVLAYETLSETHWNAPGIEPVFSPNLFINIDKFIDDKIKIMSIYKSQLDKYSRSQQPLKSLANFRGSQNGCKYAEAFQVIRFLS